MSFSVSILIAAVALSGDGGDAPKPLGCAVGAEIPSFYVREANSNQPNLAVCLVCKNGDRPVIMIAARRIDAQLERLLRAVDRTIDSKRAEGLRGFALFIPTDAAALKELPARLTTLAHDANLALPLTIPVESTTGPAALKLPEDVQTTVLLYRNKRVVQTFFVNSEQLSERQIEQIIDAANRLTAAPSGSGQRE